ncbi:MAG TPA: hypothetical protein VIM64_24090 [Puia sp.]
MTHTFSTILRMLAGLLLPSSMACKKLPGELPCECDTNPPMYKKGGGPQKLAVCGTLNLPIDTTNYLIDIIAYVGYYSIAHETLPELNLHTSTSFFNDPSTSLQIYGLHWYFSVNTTLKDRNGNTLLQMMDSKWYVYTNNISKYNYDARGLEIFDKQGHIAFSITDDGTSLMVQGLFPQPDGTFLFAEVVGDGPLAPFYLPSGTPELNAIFDSVYNQYPIQPLFRYTGPNWQHARL